MAGIEDQVREMEQRLAAQFQQQLLQAQEGQRLQLETRTQLVTQQRVAGAGLEQQVAALQHHRGLLTYFDAHEGFDCQANAQALDNGTTPTKQP